MFHSAAVVRGASGVTAAEGPTCPYLTCPYLTPQKQLALRASWDSGPAWALCSLWTPTDNQDFLANASFHPPLEQEDKVRWNFTVQDESFSGFRHLRIFRSQVVCNLKKDCNVAFLDYCLSTVFRPNLDFLIFWFFSGGTSFIHGVLPCGLPFKEALKTRNALLFLACLADSGKAFSSCIVVTCISSINIWCFWVAISHNKMFYVPLWERCL